MVKVTVNFLQVLYYIGRLSANWSPIVTAYLTIVGAVGSPNVFSIDCAMKWSFYTRLTVIYFAPAMVTGVTLLVYGMRHILRKKTAKETLDDAQQGCMIVLYLVHPTILSEVVRALPCDPVAGTGTKYLRADMSIDCHSREYRGYALLSLLYLVFYVFGMIVYLTYRGLYHNYKSGKLFRLSLHPATRKYAFFVSGYRRETYYWEAVVMARKLSIVCLLHRPSPSMTPDMVVRLVPASSLFGIRSGFSPFQTHLVTVSSALVLSS